MATIILNGIKNALCVDSGMPSLIASWANFARLLGIGFPVENHSIPSVQHIFPHTQIRPIYRSIGLAALGPAQVAVGQAIRYSAEPCGNATSHAHKVCIVGVGVYKTAQF